MKNVTKFLAILLLIAASSTHAMLWEIGIRVQNSSNNLIKLNLSVYGYDSSTKNYNLLFSDTSRSVAIDGTHNVIFNIVGISDDYPYASASLDYYPAYVFLIGNNYKRVDMPLNGWQDYTIVYTQNSGWGSASAGSQSSGTWAEYNITLKNYMGKDEASGKIYINSDSVVTGKSGVTLRREASTFPHTISGKEQTVSGVFRKWRNWSDSYTGVSRDLNANNYNLTAKYASQYTANISTSMGGGYVYVNSSQYNCPTSGAYIYDDLNNSITATDQELNGFSCTFSQWKENGSFKSSQNTIYFNEPSSSTSLVAEYTRKISNVGEALYFGSTQSNPIVLYWTNNSNATGYEIWRKVRTNGVWGSPYQIATVTNGSGTYTDEDYKLNAWKQGTELEYDVRAYSSSYTQDPQWATVYGSMNAKLNNSLAENILTETETPTEYSVSNYPNPFNPTTTINYQLPKDGVVSIKVYDVLGKEVAALVNEQKSAGYYKVEFNGNGLTSGLYICSIQAGSFSKSIKLMLTK